MTRTLRRIAAPLTLLAIVATTSCGGGETADAEPLAADPGTAETTTDRGVRVISADEAADVATDPPRDLVVLDVRTPEEHSEGHLAGAVLIDFYEPDFTDRIAELDRDVPYLLYCRSGNRSAQAREIMADLGFADVADVDGGITALIGAGHPVVTG